MLQYDLELGSVEVMMEGGEGYEWVVEGGNAVGGHMGAAFVVTIVLLIVLGCAGPSFPFRTA